MILISGILFIIALTDCMVILTTLTALIRCVWQVFSCWCIQGSAAEISGYTSSLDIYGSNSRPHCFSFPWLKHFLAAAAVAWHPFLILSSRLVKLQTLNVSALQSAFGLGLRHRSNDTVLSDDFSKQWSIASGYKLIKSQPRILSM